MFAWAIVSVFRFIGVSTTQDKGRYIFYGKYLGPAESVQINEESAFQGSTVYDLKGKGLSNWLWSTWVQSCFPIFFNKSILYF